MILGAGTQLITPGAAPVAPDPVGSFNITELGDKADKIGKDDNFRDQGADPNKLVAITDPLAATSPAAGESFRTVRAARFAEVLRGVSFAPRLAR